MNNLFFCSLFRAPEIWFDDVDDVLLDKQPVSTLDQPDKLVKLESFTG